MAYQSVGIGSADDDGGGDTLRAGGTKINANFVELYTALGTGSALSSGISADASIITLTTPVIAEIDSGSSITLDATTDIYLNADGGDIFFQDGATTFGSANNNSGNLTVKSGTTTALTFSGANVTVAGTVASGAITSSGVVTGTGFTIGSAVIAEAELEQIDGVTAGTVAASKSVVVDSNKDIGTFRNLTIDGVFTDGNYTFDTSGNVSGLGTVGSGAITSSGVITGTTVEATGDTSAGDNAAIGYTATEGLILTGQGSTSDITIKNDADATVLSITTGTTDVTLTGAVAFAVGSDPSTVANHAHIYAKDDSASAEVYVQDEAGNATKISPHNEQGEWEYFSKNTKTGKIVRVNMEEMIKDIEILIGKSYIKNE
tara:strand:- start:3563 stop:4687 length:1125 start_codon:yes stop_codon:yes gene_type:complete